MINIKSKQDQFVGVRFTEKEKELIDKFIQKKNISYNEFIRDAVFSYINNIETVKNKVNIKKIYSNIQEFEKILPELIRKIHNLYRECEQFKLNKDVYFIV
ncbi:MAG: DUF6290 family protein [Promethearchaeota archaeon]